LVDAWLLMAARHFINLDFQNRL